MLEILLTVATYLITVKFIKSCPVEMNNWHEVIIGLLASYSCLKSWTVYHIKGGQRFEMDASGGKRYSNLFESVSIVF